MWPEAEALAAIPTGTMVPNLGSPDVLGLKHPELHY